MREMLLGKYGFSATTGTTKTGGQIWQLETKDAGTKNVGKSVDMMRELNTYGLSMPSEVFANVLDEQSDYQAYSPVQIGSARVGGGM